MTRRVHTMLAVLLVLCIVGISGVASAQSVLHESHHSHHQADTHASAFCTWMCAAGQAGETATVLALQDAAPREFIDLFSPDHVTTVWSSLRTTRAPPAPCTV